MPAIDFPSAPAVNDEYSFEGRTWLWNGTGWEVKPFPAALQLGTAANPSLYFTGDPNTGIYSPGADQVAISTNGSRRLNIDSTGNLVLDTGDATIYGVRVGRGNSARADNTAVGKNALNANTTGDYGVAVGSGALQLNQGGISNVAVGLSALGSNVSGNSNTGMGTEALQVNTGSSNTCIGASAGKALTTGSNNTIIGEIQGTAGLGNTVIIGAGSTERLRIDSSGRLGLGTSSPDALLTVNGIGAFGAGAVTTPSVAATGDLNTGFWFPAADTIAASTGGSERARIDSSGRLLIGTSSSIPTSFPGLLQVNYGGGYTADFGRFTNDIFGGFLNLVKGRGGAPGTRTIVQSGDILGLIDFTGDDGTDLASIGATIRGEVDGTPGANDMPGRLVFSVTADGAASPTEALRIKNSRIINIANTPVYADNAAAKTGGLVDGDVYRKSDGTLMIVYT